MRYISYCFSTLLLLFIFSSCGSESTPVYNLTTTPTPDEAGSVSPSSGEYDEGETVEVTATSNDDWLFDGWEGDASGSENPTTVTMDTDKDIAATFVLREYPLTIETEGEGTVSEQIVQEKTTDYEAGTTIELTAEPADGWEFIEWQGDLQGNENPQQITVDNEKSVTAVFEKQNFTFTIKIDGEGNVEHKEVQAKTTDYSYGSEVELTAIPADNWEFVEWQGDLEGDQNPDTTTVTSETDITAVFVEPVFAGGNGTVEDPYQIASISQLQSINENEYLDKHFIQVNDIDASETSQWNFGEGFQPIGDLINRFKGTYDGDNYVINDLTINKPEENFIGLFSIIQEGDLVNIVLENVNIIGSDYVGGLAGGLDNGQIDNSSTSGSVTGNYAGGIVGTNTNEGVVINSSSAVIITGGEQAGGLVGRNNGGEITNSFAEGNVSGTRYIGGLAGYNTEGKISNSHSSGNVHGDNNIGGLVGTNWDGKISQSYASGNVTADGDLVGGLVGVNRDEISNSYATGDVSGDYAVGGLIGIQTDSGILTYTYSTGETSGNGDVGGFIGVNDATIQFSYWDSEANSENDGVGSGSSNGLTDLNTSVMQGASAEENMPEFDWDEIWMTVSDDYPILRWQQ